MGWLQNIRKVIPPGPAGNHDSARDLNEKPGNENDDVLLEELPGVLQSLKDSTSKFNDLAQEQKMGVIQQSSSLHQVAVTSEEISAAAKSISQSADSVEQSALQSIDRLP